MSFSSASGLAIDCPPWRLSGLVLGCLMNDPEALAALGDAVHAAPYKAPPSAPVLYIKPRNTLAAADAAMRLHADVHALEVGATVALVMARSACRVSESQALDHVAGFALLVDISVPHTSFYRPSVRFKALDGSCRIGRVVARNASVAAPVFEIEVEIDGQHVQRSSTAGFTRQAARLIADVSAFMTLRAGDILMLGVAADAPQARAGQRVRVEAAGLGVIEFAIELAQESAA